MRHSGTILATGPVERSRAGTADLYSGFSDARQTAGIEHPGQIQDLGHPGRSWRSLAIDLGSDAGPVSWPVTFAAQGVGLGSACGFGRAAAMPTMDLPRSCISFSQRPVSAMNSAADIRPKASAVA